jgi:hypothetical protein
MAQTLKFGNGVWANKEGLTLAYNDENGNYKPLPFNFTRSTSATRVNKQGLIEVVRNNKPRIDYKDSAKGALILEPSRSNLFLYSESLETGWTGAGTNPPVLTASQFISPDGSQNASRLQIPSTGTTSIFYQLFSHTIGTQYTISGYVKSNTSTNQEFKLYGDFGAPSGISGVLTATSEWQRFSFTYTATATGSRSGGFYYVPNIAADLQVYGIQVEVGSYSTSFIPTQGSTVTRVAETANGAGNSEVFNDSEGVLFADVSALADDQTLRMLSVSDGTNNNRIRINYTTTSNQLQARIVDGGSTVVDFIENLNDITIPVKLAIKYKINDCALWVNGFKVATDTSATMPSGLKTLNFDGGDGGFDFYSSTKELGYYDAALTDTELEYLTSYRSWESIVNELNLNIIYNG